MAAACPRCGFAYQWDGATCGHCDPRPEPRRAAADPPRPSTGVPWLDRVVAMLVCGVVAAVLWGVVALLLAGWEAVKDVVGAALTGQAAEGVPVWKEVVVFCIGLGFLFGLWCGWSLTTADRRERGRAARRG